MPNKIVVVGSKEYGEPLRDFGEITCDVRELFQNPEDVKLLVFTGGEDVHPSFYRGVDCGASFTNLNRDAYEKHLFKVCLKRGIKMTGICRGFQFLNVMCGGRMYQHFLGHAIFGRHPAYFAYNGETVPVSSTHHQLVELGPEATPLVWSSEKRSSYYIDADGECVNDVEKEIEGAVFPRFNAFGVQFHPEMMGEDERGRVYYQEMIHDFLRIKKFKENYEEKINVRGSSEPRRGVSAGSEG